MILKRFDRSVKDGLRIFGAVILCTATFSSAVAQAQTCAPPKNSDWSAWLDAQENAGGHAEACHVNVAVNGLIGRLEGRGGAKGATCASGGAAASSWSDVSSLLNAIKPTINQSSATYASSPAGNHVITGTAGQTIGTTVTAYTDNKDFSKNRSPCPGNNGYVCSTTKNWTAVVQSDGNGGCFLLTAYPN